MFSATWPQSIQKLAHEFLKVFNNNINNSFNFSEKR